jgi:hypothetical protein
MNLCGVDGLRTFCSTRGFGRMPSLLAKQCAVKGVKGAGLQRVKFPGSDRHAGRDVYYARHREFFANNQSRTYRALKTDHF